MDFVRERREWEERIKMRAPVEAEVEVEAEAGGDMDVDGVGDDGHGGRLLTEEEEEIEALAQYLVDVEEQEHEDVRVGKEGGDGEGCQWQQQRRALDSRGDGHHGSYGSDEEDYDQLFMEVIGASQEAGGLQQRSAHRQPWDRDGGVNDFQEQSFSRMDLS